MEANVSAGWAAVCVACAAFGSFAVPMKNERVIEANVHPLTFQTYKTFWVLATSMLTFFFIPVEVSPWGFVSGLSWVPAGVAAVVSVQNVGLGVGQGTWSSLIVLVSFAWGLLVFQEPVSSSFLACLGIVLLCLGVYGMSRFARQGNASENSRNGDDLGDSKALAGDREDGTQLSLLREVDGGVDAARNGEASIAAFSMIDGEMETVIGSAGYEQSGTPGPSHSSWKLGMAAAVFNGVWGGSNMVPLKLAGGSSSHSGIGYVFSFAVGSAAVNICLWLALLAWYRCKVSALPSLEVRTMLVPGAIAGVLWSLGNVAAIVAVLNLGQAVGYSSCQASIMVSGLWSIFYYGEVSELRQIILWLCSALLALSGIIVLSAIKR